MGPVDSGSCRNPRACGSAVTGSGAAVSAALRIGCACLPYLARDSPGSTMEPAENADGSSRYSVDGLGRGVESVFTGACGGAAAEADDCGWYFEIDSPGNKIGSGRGSNPCSDLPSWRDSRRLSWRDSCLS